MLETLAVIGVVAVILGIGYVWYCITGAMVEGASESFKKELADLRRKIEIVDAKVKDIQRNVNIH